MVAFFIPCSLNSDEKHQELTAKKKQKRIIEKNVEFSKNSTIRIGIPIEMIKAMGINEEERKVIIIEKLMKRI